jgi:hypothetical protein
VKRRAEPPVAYVDALSNGEILFLDMGALKAANSTALAWTDVGKAGIDTTNYDPVMALAQNHIHFLNVPGTPAGEAEIFVIHCASSICLNVHREWKELTWGGV